MAELDPETLLPNERLREQARAGDVTQIHRGNRYADPGDTLVIGDTTLAVVDVTERTLGDLTDEDARAEGASDLAEYRERLHRAHDHFEWDDDAGVVRHRFDRRD